MVLKKEALMTNVKAKDRSLVAAKNDIQAGFFIPKECREIFLPLGDPACVSLFSCGIFLAGSSRLTRGYLISRRNPDFHLALFTRNGSAEFRTPETSGKLEAGTLLVVPAHQVCAYSTDRSWDIVWFHFKENKHWAHLSGARVEVKMTDRADLLDHLSQSLVRECQSGAGKSIIATNMAQLLRSILENEVGISRAGNAVASIVSRLAERVNGQLQFSWTAKTLADEAALSERHLRRAVRSAYGEAPMKMVTRLRLERAKTLLSNTDYRIEDVAAMVGYSDPFAFSTAFKRAKGKSPRDFRKNETG